MHRLRPENSIVHQSRNAIYHPGVCDDLHKRNIRVNGDGFGLAWYSSEEGVLKGSCVFRLITPAWSSENLRNICDHIHAPVFFAHVRAATDGNACFEEQIRARISAENCHPFHYKRYTFMHNGGVAQFDRMKRSLINMLAEEIYHNIEGSTDSEHLFALFLSMLQDTDRQISVQEFAEAVNKTISTLLELSQSLDIHEPSSLNIVVSDGVHVIATRYRCGNSQPPSLYYNYGAGFSCEGSSFRCSNRFAPKEIVIASEPLSKLPEDEGVYDCSTRAASPRIEDMYGTWMLVPKDYMLICEGDGSDMSKVHSVRVEPIEVSSIAKDHLRTVRSNSMAAAILHSISSSPAIGEERRSFRLCSPRMESNSSNSLSAAAARLADVSTDFSKPANRVIVPQAELVRTPRGNEPLMYIHFISLIIGMVAMALALLVAKHLLLT